MNSKEKLQLMSLINKYEITKNNNKYHIARAGGEIEYIFKKKSDAIKFGYFLTMVSGNKDNDIVTQKITIEDCVPEINIFIHDTLLDIFVMVGQWVKGKFEKDSWYYSLELDMNCGHECIGNFDNFIEIIEDLYNIKISKNSINDNTTEYFTNEYIDWEQLIDSSMVIKRDNNTDSEAYTIEEMFNIESIE